MEEFRFISSRIHLKRGDTLFVYTHGVTEAMNDKGGTLGDTRLVDGLGKAAGRVPEEITRGITEK